MSEWIQFYYTWDNENKAEAWFQFRTYYAWSYCLTFEQFNYEWSNFIQQYYHDLTTRSYRPETADVNNKV
jgi:hypothetical protein